MKRIFKILLILIFSASLFSCITKEKPFKNIEQLKSDIRFVRLIENNIAFIDNIRDKKKVSYLLEKEITKESQLNELATALGFNDWTEYEGYVFEETNKLNELEIEYNLSSYSEDEIIELGIDAIHANDSKVLLKSTDPCNCERIRTNCIIEAAAAATLAHLGCLSVDWTGIGAPICHGAVIILQIAASDNCNANAENCINDCDNR